MQPVERARRAVALGDHRTAYDHLVEADRTGSLGFDGLALLADVAYATGDVEMTFAAWEQAHDRAAASGDRVAAATAAARIAMHLLMDTGLLAPVRVWVKRAEHLLQGEEAGPVEATLAVAQGYERLLFGDFPAALRWSRRAIDLATAHDAAAPAALGRVMQARGVLFAEDVVQGLELLDESAALALSDELDPLSVGLVYCELVCAWQGLAQYDRAEELTTAMERWSHQHRDLGSVHGRCRVHRAEMLRLRGALADAEQHALRACEELRPYLRREYGWPLTELGRIRLHKGDLAGAEAAFLEAHQAGWDPNPGLALLRLEQGEVDTAATTIADALDQPLGIPSKELPPNTELRRAPLFAAQAEICAAAGQLDKARTAADHLEEIARVFASPALYADASFARGVVELAEGDTPAARHAFKRAVDHYHQLAMPYEAARARLGLARAHRAQGGLELGRLELHAATSAFKDIGARRQATQAAAEEAEAADGAPDASTRPQPPHGTRQPAGEPGVGSVGRFQPEGEYWSLVYADRTAHVRDLKGLRYLARLLGEPDREFHALDLVTSEHGVATGPARSEPELRRRRGDETEPLLDDRAKTAYRRRLEEIDQEIDEARSQGDDERAARATVERDFLVRELSRAVGLGGRDRPAGADSERARVSVTRAIRYALDRIRQLHPPLAAHLDHAVRTGTYVAYCPDPHAPVRWEL